MKNTAENLRSSKHKLTIFGCLFTAVVLIGAAVITACAVNLKSTKAAEDPAVSLVILGGATPEYTGEPQKVVTSLPAGMRYAISTEYVDPTTIDAGKIVPAGYTALDYLKGSNSEYIETGFSTTTGMVVKYAATWYDRGSSRHSEVVVGSDNNCGYLSYGKTWKLGSKSKTLSGSYPSAYDTKYSVKFSTVSNNVYLEVDGNRIITDTSAISTSGSVYLFTGSPSGTFNTKADLYYATIWDSAGKLVRDFVPVRQDSSGTLGMYDVYNDKFYTPSWSGRFTAAGDVVNSELKNLNLEWLDSVDDPRNEKVLEANTKYYVYYYTPNSDTTEVTSMAVEEIDVKCINHDYGEWQVTSPESCTDTGEQYHTCQKCGHTETAEIPATEHNFSVASFDKETGITTLVCSVCSTVSDITYECTDREHGHDFIDSTIDPDCEEIGYTKHACVNCQYSYNDNYLPATGHSYGEWKTIEEPSINSAGVQQRTCEHCGATQNRTLGALSGTTSGGKDNTAPLLWGIIIGVLAVLAGCGGLAWLLLVVFNPKRQKKTKVAAAWSKW